MHYHFSCTARINQRADAAAEALEIPAVLQVTVLMTGQNNLLIEAVATEEEEITQIATELDHLNLEINDENLIRTRHTQARDYVEVTLGNQAHD